MNPRPPLRDHQVEQLSHSIQLSIWIFQKINKHLSCWMEIDFFLRSELNSNFPFLISISIKNVKFHFISSLSRFNPKPGPEIFQKSAPALDKKSFATIACCQMLFWFFDSYDWHLQNSFGPQHSIEHPVLGLNMRPLHGKIWHWSW